MAWIVIPGWEKFQHPDTARSGTPPWIKAYTSLMSKDEFLDLTPALRGLLFSCWLEYARSHRQLRDDTSKLSRRLNMRVTRNMLDSLNHAGFIEFSASNPASSLQADMQDEKGERKDQGDLRLLPPLEDVEMWPKASGQ